MFPDANSSNLYITCHVLTTDFLIYGTDMGNIVYFHVEEWAIASEFTHPVGVTNIWADPAGTRLVFIDIKGQGYVYNAVINQNVVIPDLPNKVVGVTWDSNIHDRNIFIVYDQHDIYTYVYVKYSIYGTDS